MISSQQWFLISHQLQWNYPFNHLTKWELGNRYHWMNYWAMNSGINHLYIYMGIDDENGESKNGKLIIWGNLGETLEIPIVSPPQGEMLTALGSLPLTHGWTIIDVAERSYVSFQIDCCDYVMLLLIKKTNKYALLTTNRHIVWRLRPHFWWLIWYWSGYHYHFWGETG